MKKILLFIIAGIGILQLSAQKKLQALNPTRLGIFKNGTCFVKREGLVNVTEKSFYIKAPDKVLMGTYWVFVGKEATLQSIVVKTDTFKTSHTAHAIGEFLEANVGQNITLYGNAQNTELRKLSGKLLEYDAASATMKIAIANGKTVIAGVAGFDWMETAGNPQNTILRDSIIPIAKVKLNKQADNIVVSTISLEKGVQWFPSYLFTVVNDKEARLEMKATIVNGETEYSNMPVDIIIGNPEMFYGQRLDPACIEYLNESLLGSRYDNNGLSNTLNTVNISTQAVGNVYNWAGNDNDADDPGKAGQKLEDLYYYQLGVIDLEKNARVIVPVMTAAISYSEIYTASLPLHSTMLEGANSIQTYHSFLVNNNTSAPLTSGAVLVMNAAGQPLAQAQLNYTPVKGSSEMQLSKAIDVQVKNEEEESGREKSTVKKNATEYYEKVTHNGVINIMNYKDKKITIRINKTIDGIFVKADNNGKSRKIKSEDDDDTISQLYWQVEVAPGAKMKLQYTYYNLD
ncbi:hypothetical protein [Ferruginibacter sp. SUN106]|uniref:hypothetical protein n=1 Tax=Ferruginibacter sp. SUN106 TaxID=2978348 RepID=UPI003D35A4C3